MASARDGFGIWPPLNPPINIPQLLWEHSNRRPSITCRLMGGHADDDAREGPKVRLGAFPTIQVDKLPLRHSFPTGGIRCQVILP
jgi:hypothetical protein